MKKVALVTAAGSGIGAGVAKELTRISHDLVLLSPSGSVAKLASEVGVAGRTGSIENDSDVQLMRDTALEKFGRIDAAFIGTGHAPGSSEHSGRHFHRDSPNDFMHLTNADWKKAFELYYLGIVRVARILRLQQAKSRPEVS